MTHSMTGFARFSQQISVAQLVYEIRTLNHRYLDMTFRLPEALQSFEPLLRHAVRQTFKRGKFDVCIKLHWHADAQNVLPIDQSCLSQLLEAMHRVAVQMANPAAVSPLEVLRWPGILGLESFDQAKLWSDVEYGFKQCLMILQGVRENEGQMINAYLMERLHQIEHICGGLQQQLPDLLQQQQQRLQQRFQEAQLALDAERLAQEMLLWAQRLDVAEEISRLLTHTHAVKQLLQQNDGHGRRLDFLMQELNREANTLASKSLSALQTEQAIELKVLIEQMREQVQNIE